MNAVIRTVMLKELRESLRDRRTLMTSMVLGPIFAPLFFILVLKLALSRSVASQDVLTPVTVANAAAAPNLVQQLRESGLIVTLRDGTDAEIRAWITAEEDLVVLRVPDLDAALGLIERHEFGNGTAIFTASGCVSAVVSWGILEKRFEGGRAQT